MDVTAWLRALWQRLSGQVTQRALGPVPQRVQTLTQLYRFQPERYQHYSATQGQGRILSVPWPTLDEYTAALAEAAQTVRDDRPISPDWYPREIVQVSLDRFLTSKDGFYLDPPEAVAKFKHVAVQLCEAMESSDELTYGLPEHNLRMLARVLINLQSLTIQLAEAAEQ